MSKRRAHKNSLSIFRISTYLYLSFYREGKRGTNEAFLDGSGFRNSRMKELEKRWKGPAISGSLSFISGGILDLRG
jgi:hypothetical protein